MNVVQDLTAPSDRRSLQRDRLVACAKAAIAAEGLAGLRARDLAACAGCSVGAIYNLVADLNELALRVGQTTLRDLETFTAAAVPAEDADPETFVALALAYCRFAATNRNRWRALFEFRLPDGRALPEWFVADQTRLFKRLETRLARRLPDLDPATLAMRTRTFFAAVHGIVALGLDEKIVALPVEAIEGELAAFVRAYLAGAGLMA